MGLQLTPRQEAIYKQYQQDIASGKVKKETTPFGNVITDGVKKIMVTNTIGTLEAYDQTFINPVNTASNFLALMNRVTIYVGPPDTGKTYQAQDLCIKNNIKYIIIPCHDGLTLETLLEDFVLVNGQPTYQPSLALQMLSDPNNTDCIIILDELNTCRTAVLKTFQPLFDNTSKSFVYRGQTYKKNMNCKFICTLNDKDKGISILPDAILSRSCLKYFVPVDDATLVLRTGYKQAFIQACRGVFRSIGLEGIFGVRQLNAMYNLNAVDAIDHLKGLLALKNLDFAALDTMEFQNQVQQMYNCK